MASAATFLCFFVFLSFLTNGSSECSQKSVEILEYPTLRRLKEEAEWQVYITNKCNCSIYDLKLECPDFRPASRINRHFISKIDGNENYYLVNNGKPIHPNTTFDFNFFHSIEFNPYEFALLDYKEDCS